MISSSKEKEDSFNQLNEILAQRPYSLYSFLLNLEKNTEYLKLSLSRLNLADVEELTRCSFERTLNFLTLARSKEKQRQLEERNIKHMKEVRSELRALLLKIEGSPFFESRVKGREKRSEAFDL